MSVKVFCNRLKPLFLVCPCSLFFRQQNLALLILEYARWFIYLFFSPMPRWSQSFKIQVIAYYIPPSCCPSPSLEMTATGKEWKQKRRVFNISPDSSFWRETSAAVRRIWSSSYKLPAPSCPINEGTHTVCHGPCHGHYPRSLKRSPVKTLGLPHGESKCGLICTCWRVSSEILRALFSISRTDFKYRCQ